MKQIMTGNMNKLEILYQTKSREFYTALNQKLSNTKLKGGRLYEKQMLACISDFCNVTIDKNAVFEDINKIKYPYNLYSTNYNLFDVVIQEPYPLSVLGNSKRIKQIAIIHHIDETIFKKSLIHKLIFKRLISTLKKIECVVPECLN